jgi:hypothetical protein
MDYLEIADDIRLDFDGRHRSTSERTTIMLNLVRDSTLISPEIKAVLHVLINHYEEAESN